MSWWSDDDEEDDDYLDESDVRVRPNPRGSRPRTKTRPSHSQAVPGRVLGVDRGRFSVLVAGGAGGEEERVVTAARARELGRSAIVTGDRVDVVGDTSGDEGSLARVVRVAERSTVLRRSADDSDEVERVLVANADRMLVVVAAADPEPRVRLIDRYLVAAYDAGIEPILAVTKTDLADPAPLAATFAETELRIVTSRSGAVPVDLLIDLLVGHETVLVGHSGVGKSTLVNAIVPDARRATGAVNEVTGRGRHTSSSTVSLRVAGRGESEGRSGWIVDTPGVRSFGLGHVRTESILAAFGDLAIVAESCPRGCTHLPDAPDCAIAEAVEEGTLGPSGPARLDSLHRLLLAARG